MLARTGLRVTELCELTDVPLHPSLIELHRIWREWAGPDDTGRLSSNQGRVRSDPRHSAGDTEWVDPLGTPLTITADPQPRPRRSVRLRKDP